MKSDEIAMPSAPKPADAVTNTSGMKHPHPDPWQEVPCETTIIEGRRKAKVEKKEGSVHRKTALDEKAKSNLS